MDSFFITLPSDSSHEIYPDNKPGHFYTKLKQDITLVGSYEVAIVELQFKHDFHNFQINENQPVFYLHIPYKQLLENVTFDPSFYKPSMFSKPTEEMLNLIKEYQNNLERLWQMSDSYAPLFMARIERAEENYFAPKAKISLLIKDTIAKFHNSTSEGDALKELEDLIKMGDVLERIRSSMVKMFTFFKEFDTAELYDILGADMEKVKKSMVSLFEASSHKPDSQRPKRDTKDFLAEIFKPGSLLFKDDDNAEAHLDAQNKNTQELSSIYFQLKALYGATLGQTSKIQKVIETIQQQNPETSGLSSSSAYSTVPLLFLPTTTPTGDAPTYNIPVYARSGFYSVPSKLVEALNASLKHNKYIKNLDRLVYFSYDMSLKRFKLHVGYDISAGLMAEEFANALGFTTIKHKGTIIAKRAAQYHERWQLMYVYSDIVDYNFVGDTMSQLSRCIPVEGERDSYTVVRFDSPHFLPVLKNHISTLEIVLANEYMETFPIRSGKTIVKLMFRPRVKHIF